VIDLHTANLKFMNSTLPAHHHQPDGHARIKIADLNNALENIMTLQAKAQSPKQGGLLRDIGHGSPYKASILPNQLHPAPPPQINADLMINSNSALSI
jgi:hypothetical protein